MSKGLSNYIKGLIKDDNLASFYKSKAWRILREEVLEEYRHECQRCLERGRYTHATMVHHVQEVRRRPDLALSKTYVDAEGIEHRQLIPLCHACHEKEHDKLGEWIEKNSEPKFENEERW